MTRSWTRTSQSSRRGREYDPYAHADELGLQVLHRPIRTAHELWLPEHRTLVIKDGMRAVHQRNACAHGVAHAALAHPDDRPKHEMQADRYAVERLINVDEALELMQWAPDLPRLAAELGVTNRFLRVFLNVNGLAS